MKHGLYCGKHVYHIMQSGIKWKEALLVYRNTYDYRNCIYGSNVNKGKKLETVEAVIIRDYRDRILWKLYVYRKSF